jgi:hypothetical protein
MRKTLLLIFTLVFIFSIPLGARSIGEVDIGLSGIYHTSEDQGVKDFFEGMGKGENWTVGINLNARLSLINLSFMVMIPTSTLDGSQELNLLSSLSIDIPLVTDLLYFSVGGGLTTDFVFSGEESEALILGRPIDEVTFKSVVLDSPIHFKYGLDLFNWFGKNWSFLSCRHPFILGVVGGFWWVVKTFFLSWEK